MLGSALRGSWKSSATRNARPSDAAGSGCRTSQLETRARRAALPVRVRHGVPCVTADNRPLYRRRNARAGHCPREQSLGKAVAADKAQRLAPASHSDDGPNPSSPKAYRCPVTQARSSLALNWCGESRSGGRVRHTTARQALHAFGRGVVLSLRTDLGRALRLLSKGKCGETTSRRHAL